MYLLKLINGKIYTGSSKDVKERLNRHTEGSVNATKNFLPVKLIWYCAFSKRQDALNFEKYLKSGSGQGFRNRHLI